MDVTKPYKFIGFGDIHGPKHYKFIGFGDHKHTNNTTSTARRNKTPRAKRMDQAVGSYNFIVFLNEIGVLKGPNPQTSSNGPRKSMVLEVGVENRLATLREFR